MIQVMILQILKGITTFLKKNFTTIILIALVAILIFQLKNYREELRRNQDNFEQIINNSNSKILKLTKSEFKKMQKEYTDTLLNEIMDSLKINFRHINKTITHQYKYTYDTTITHLYPATPGYKTFYKKFDDCLEISGKMDYKKDNIIFDKAQINYSATSVYFWKRKNKLFNIIPVGRKINYVETKNNCNGTTTVKEIKIIKK